jgi:uncharacterized protein YdaU (DUF1376 family)
MHYYKLHIGDYRRDTSALSLVEHGVYLSLMAEYYVTERPLPDNLDVLCRICRAVNRAERQAVNFVMDKYFHKTPEGLWHKRIDHELEVYQNKSEANQKNGLKGGRPKKGKPKNNPPGLVLETPSDSETKPKDNPNHEPVTNNQIERENAGAPEASLVQQIVAAYPLRDSPMECLESVELALAAGEDAQHMLASVQACVAQIRLAPGGPGNRFVPSARNFFQREEWRSTEKFKKLSQTLPQFKAAASPTAYAGKTNEELAQAWAKCREKYATPKAAAETAASDDEDMKPF